MTKNPIYNALIAAGYIVSLISLMFLADKLFGTNEASVFIPMAMLSVLVFSVALMAYLFFYQPVVMLIEGKRDEAVRFFLKTLGTFAVTTIIILLVSLFATR